MENVIRGCATFFINYRTNENHTRMRIHVIIDVTVIKKHTGTVIYFLNVQI
jgi:hypothetical protein